MYIEKEIPNMCCNTTAILLHSTKKLKRGPQEPLNSRTISLLLVIYKLFTKALTKRITTELDENQSQE